MIDFVLLERWHSKNGFRYPWRKSRDPYRILMTEIMLQRTRADKVAELYRPFFDMFPSPEYLADASVASIRKVIAPLGLSHRAPRMKALGRELEEIGSVPKDRDSLLKLPGVGPYVADAVLCYAFGRGVIPVDANIERLFFACFGSCDPKNVTSKILMESTKNHPIPIGIRELNWAFLDIAKTVCKPRNPSCGSCPLPCKSRRYPPETITVWKPRRKQTTLR